MDDKVLALLADGEFHSGDELGGLLGISRAAVWKRLQKMEALGVAVESVKGRGYRIAGGLDLISRSQVEVMMDQRAAQLVRRMDVLSQTTSTNDVALQEAESGEVGYVCVAEQQTRGKGRRGRAWVSPFASSLYVSVVWEFSGGAAALEGLSLAVGVAVESMLAKAGVTGLRLKWPNDVLFNNRKLGGILIEMVGDAAGACQVVVGVGINVALPGKMGAVIDQPFTDLQAVSGKRLSRSALLAQLLNELMPMLADFERNTFAAYRDRWLQLDAFQGKEVFLQLGASTEVGIASGVDDSGALLLSTAAGLKKFSGGEVSLREAG